MVDEKKKPVEKEEKKVESKKTEKAPEKKNVKEEMVVTPKRRTSGSESGGKDSAFVNARSLRISSKYCFAICKVLKGKSPEQAIEVLENVVKMKRAIPMHGREVAHQKGAGMAGGRYPQKASLEIINLLKQLKANADVNGVENPVIVIAKADKASRPFRRAGRKAKRAHVYIEVKDKAELEKQKASAKTQGAKK